MKFLDAGASASKTVKWGNIIPTLGMFGNYVPQCKANVEISVCTV